MVYFLLQIQAWVLCFFDPVLYDHAQKFFPVQILYLDLYGVPFKSNEEKVYNCHEILSLLVPVATLRGTLDVNNMFSTEKYHNLVILHICVDGFQEISYILV